MPHVIYKHFMGEIVVPNKYKLIPVLIGDGFRPSSNGISMIDVVKKNYRYILKARSKVRNCRIYMRIDGDDDYVTIDGEFLMLHPSIEFEGCETVIVASSSWRVKYCSVMIDGGGHRYAIIRH